MLRLSSNFRSSGYDVSIGVADAIDRVLIVDDDAGARAGFAYSVEDLGMTPVAEEGPITDLRGFVGGVTSRARAVLCDYRLKAHGGYSSFNGDEIVAACYQHGIPSLLCTQYTDVVTEMNRRLLRFIPSLLKTSSPEPNAILSSLMRCQDELSGSFHPGRKPWRSLVRVHDVPQDCDYCHVVVPAWNPDQEVRLYFNDVPSGLHQIMRAGSRMHAQVNIGAGSVEDLYFDEWEPE